MLVGLSALAIAGAQTPQVQTWPAALPSAADQREAMKALFMQQATYFAGSIADPLASGYGTSSNMPKPIGDKNLLGKGLQAILSKAEKGLDLEIANGGASEAWLRAGDSNILGYLQAKDANGTWRPIEFHYWMTCGNSFHRVQLPIGQAWTFAISLPSVGSVTQIRWHYQSGQAELNSNVVEVLLPATRFQLPPTFEDSQELAITGDYPILMPKRRG
jgi:hypothetical protein